MTCCGEREWNTELVKWLLGFVMVLFMLVSCSPPEPLIVTVTELSACKGWDEAGKPVGISTTFLPNEKRIFACGYVQTNYPSIALSVRWYYNNKLIFRQVEKDAKEYFYSSLEPTEASFPEGNYRIEIIVGKKLMRSTEFQVKQP